MFFFIFSRSRSLKSNMTQWISELLGKVLNDKTYVIFKCET